MATFKGYGPKGATKKDLGPIKDNKSFRGKPWGAKEEKAEVKGLYKKEMAKKMMFKKGAESLKKKGMLKENKYLRNLKDKPEGYTL